MNKSKLIQDNLRAKVFQFVGVVQTCDPKDLESYVNGFIKDLEQSKEEQCSCLVKGNIAAYNNCPVYMPKTEDRHRWFCSSLGTEPADCNCKTEDTGGCDMVCDNCPHEDTGEIDTNSPSSIYSEKDGYKPTGECDVCSSNNCDSCGCCECHFLAPLNKDWSDRFKELFQPEGTALKYINVNNFVVVEEIIKFISKEIESARASERKATIEEILVRAWVHIDEVDSKLHSEEFGKGWNENAVSMVDFLDELLSKIEK